VAEFLQLFAIGVLSSYGACFMSCWPIALPFITATSQDWKTRLFAALSFLTAKLIVYVILGVLAAYLGRFLTVWISRYSQILFLLSGVAIIILGIRAVLIGKHPCSRLFKRLKIKENIPSAAFLGVFAGLIPCATSTAVLAYIAFSAPSPFVGGLLGLAFGLGKFFSPLIPLSIFSKSIEKRLKINVKWVRIICAALVIFLGLRLIFSGINFLDF